MPYIPLSTPSLPQTEFQPGVGGAQLTSREVPVGEFACWYCNWQPSPPLGWPTPIAYCTTLTREAAHNVATDLGGRLQQVWKLVSWTRETEYGEWSSSEEIGATSS